MKAWVAGLLLVLIAHFAVADYYTQTPVGWLWYNADLATPTPKKVTQKTPQPDFNQMTATEQMSLFQKGFQEAKAQAVLYPTEQNVKTYLELQKFIGDQSGQFAAMYEPVLLQNPNLDYEVNHPTATMASQMVDQQHFADQGLAIKALAATHGILFFYRGGNQIDLMMSKIVSDFVAQYQVAVVPVSVDGVLSPYFKNSRVDQGQAQSLGVSTFPAVILVDPNSSTPPQPVAYGFLSENDLAQRFLDIAMQFKPRY